MKRDPAPNPLPAAIVTIILLGLMTIAGILTILPPSDEFNDNTTQIYFTEQEPRYSPPQPSRLLPPPPQLILQAEVHTAPELPDLSDLSAEEQLPQPPSDHALPLEIGAELTPPPPPVFPSHRNKSPHAPTADKPRFTPPVCLLAPQPDYPPALRSTRRKGSVRIRIAISANGSPTQVTILNSTHPDFSASVRRCILSRWKFQPAHQNGIPIASTATQTIYFRP